MSDFVTRLAQRQLGEISTAEPRLPERYAPISRSEASRPFAVSSRESAGRTIFESPSSRSESASLLDSALPQRPVSEEPGAQTVSQRASTATSRTPEAAQHGPSYRAEPSTETRSPVREQMQQHDVSTIPFISKDSQRQARTTLSQPLVPTAAAARLSAPLPLRSSRGGIAPMQSRYEQPDAEPPVHVTIGRIEVTAQTQPAAAKRTPAARKPAMSLEDYLARRQRRET